MDAAARGTTSRAGRGLRPRTWLGTLLVTALAAWMLFANLAGEPFFPDEMAMVGQSYYWNLYRGVDRQGHPSPWNDPDWLQYPAYDHPPLIKYLIGVGLSLGGIAVPRDLGLWVQWWRGVYLPPERPLEGLFWARLPIALCGVGACLAMFALGTQLRGRLTGIAAALLLAANPLFFTLSRRAMGDVPAEFFVLAALTVALWFWPRLFSRAFRWRAWLGFAALEGTLGAAAAMMKLNGAMALALAAGVLILGGVSALLRTLRNAKSNIRNPKSETRNPVDEAGAGTENLARAGGSQAWVAAYRAGAVLPAVGAMVAVALAVAWLLNPLLHARPDLTRLRQRLERLPPQEAKDMNDLAGRAFWGRVGFLFEFRADWKRRSLEDPEFDEFDSYRLPTVKKRLQAVFWQGFGRYSPVGKRRGGWTHETTDPATGEKVELFRECLWSARHEHPPAKNRDAAAGLTLPCLWPALIWFPLTLLGWGCMLRDGWRRHRQGEPPLAWGAALYVLAAVGSVALYIPWCWDRYFLPIVPASTLAGVYAIAAVLRRLGRRLVLEPPSS